MHPGACRSARALPRPRLELADIVRSHGEAYRRTHLVSIEQRRVRSAIERCRTAELGGHLDVCLDCGLEEPAYNSCRNRHCPKCQALAQARWVAGRMARLLPVGYFHVVFTLPSELRPLARSHRALVFDLLFRCAADSLLELGQDPARLGAQLGLSAVLHTWTRELLFHPHMHCIVTAGGLGADGQHWVHSRPEHLLPVQALAPLFRGKLLAALRREHGRGRLELPPTPGVPVDPEAFDRLLGALYRKDWHVYAKRPFGGPEQVLRYLSRYTHRVGISNDRLVSMDEHGVTFRTKAGKAISLPAEQFLGRFLEHVLPAGFVKIRHYGLMAPGNVNTKLALARHLLSAAAEPAGTAAAPPTGGASSAALPSWQQLLKLLTGIDLGRCPRCGGSNMTRLPLPCSPARSPPALAA